MTREEWEYYCTMVKDEMTSFIKSTCTPISMSEEHGHGVSWATGSYLQINNKLLLITACHSYDEVPSGGRLAHLPVQGGDYIGVIGEPTRAPLPVDAAAFEIPNVPDHSTIKFIYENDIDHRFSAVDGELLFWIGFPGYGLERHDPVINDRRRTSWFGELATIGFPMLSQVDQGQSPSHSSFDPDKHIAIHYPSAAKRSIDTPAVALPNPKGMSGSLLWDTKFVRSSRQAKEWYPSLSKVCGIIWAALDDPEVVLATKIEFVISELSLR